MPRPRWFPPDPPRRYAGRGGGTWDVPFLCPSVRSLRLLTLGQDLDNPIEHGRDQVTAGEATRDLDPKPKVRRSSATPPPQLSSPFVRRVSLT